MLTQLSYEHALKRMKMDLVATQLKAAELTDSLKSKDYIRDSEADKMRKAKQERI